MKRLIIALICLVTLSATIACEGYNDYVKKMKFEYESFLSHINDEEVGITDGGYVTVRFHELVPMTIDENIHWIEGKSVGEKTWK